MERVTRMTHGESDSPFGWKGFMRKKKTRKERVMVSCEITHFRLSILIKNGEKSTKRIFFLISRNPFSPKMVKFSEQWLPFLISSFLPIQRGCERNDK